MAIEGSYWHDPLSKPRSKSTKPDLAGLNAELSKLLDTGPPEAVRELLSTNPDTRLTESYATLVTKLARLMGDRPVFCPLARYSQFPGIGHKPDLLWNETSAEVAMCVACRKPTTFWFLEGVVPPFLQVPEVPRRLFPSPNVSFPLNLNLGGRVAYLGNRGFFHLCDKCLGTECEKCRKSRFPDFSDSDEVVTAGLGNACMRCLRKHPALYKLPMLVGPKMKGLRSVKERLKGGYFIVR